MSEWQTIDSALDRVAVLAWNGQVVHVMPVTNKGQQTIWYIENDSDGMYLDRRELPTHWMPLPKGPRNAE